MGNVRGVSVYYWKIGLVMSLWVASLPRPIRGKKKEQAEATYEHKHKAPVTHHHH